MALKYQNMNSLKDDSLGYLELSADPIKFEPVSKVTNVFFDEANKEVRIINKTAIQK